MWKTIVKSLMNRRSQIYIYVSDENRTSAENRTRPDLKVKTVETGAKTENSVTLTFLK